MFSQDQKRRPAAGASPPTERYSLRVCCEKESVQQEVRRVRNIIVITLLTRHLRRASRFSPRRQDPLRRRSSILCWRPVVRLMFARYHDNIMTAQKRRACGELWIYTHARSLVGWFCLKHTEKASKSNPFVYCANKKQTLLDFQQRASAPGSQKLHHAPSRLQTARKVLAFALCLDTHLCRTTFPLPKLAHFG